MGNLEGFYGIKHVKGHKSYSVREVNHLLNLMHWSKLSALPTMRQKRSVKLESFGCATELREAGFTLKKGSADCIYDLNFRMGS